MRRVPSCGSCRLSRLPHRAVGRTWGNCKWGKAKKKVVTIESANRRTSVVPSSLKRRLSADDMAEGPFLVHYDDDGSACSMMLCNERECLLALRRDRRRRAWLWQVSDGTQAQSGVIVMGIWIYYDLKQLSFARYSTRYPVGSINTLSFVLNHD